MVRFMQLKHFAQTALCVVRRVHDPTAGSPTPMDAWGSASDSSPRLEHSSGTGLPPPGRGGVRRPTCVVVVGQLSQLVAWCCTGVLSVSQLDDTVEGLTHGQVQLAHPWPQRLGMVADADPAAQPPPPPPQQQQQQSPGGETAATLPPPPDGTDVARNAPSFLSSGASSECMDVDKLWLEDEDGEERLCTRGGLPRISEAPSNFALETPDAANLSSAALVASRAAVAAATAAIGGRDLLLDAQVIHVEAADVAIMEGRDHSSRNHMGNDDGDGSNPSTWVSVSSGEYDGFSGPTPQGEGCSRSTSGPSSAVSTAPTVTQTAAPTRTCSTDAASASRRVSPGAPASCPRDEAPGVHTLLVQVAWRRGKALGAPCPVLLLPDSMRLVGEELAAMQPPAAANSLRRAPPEQQQHVGPQQPAASGAGEADGDTHAAYRALVTDLGVWLEITEAVLVESRRASAAEPRAGVRRESSSSASLGVSRTVAESGLGTGTGGGLSSYQRISVPGGDRAGGAGIGAGGNAGAQFGPFLASGLGPRRLGSGRGTGGGGCGGGSGGCTPTPDGPFARASAPLPRPPNSQRHQQLHRSQQQQQQQRAQGPVMQHGSGAREHPGSNSHLQPHSNHSTLQQYSRQHSHVYQHHLHGHVSQPWPTSGDEGTGRLTDCLTALPLGIVAANGRTMRPSGSHGLPSGGRLRTAMDFLSPFCTASAVRRPSGLSVGVSHGSTETLNYSVTEAAVTTSGAPSPASAFTPGPGDRPRTDPFLPLSPLSGGHAGGAGGVRASYSASLAAALRPPLGAARRPLSPAAAAHAASRPRATHHHQISQQHERLSPLQLQAQRSGTFARASFGSAAGPYSCATMSRTVSLSMVSETDHVSEEAVLLGCDLLLYLAQCGAVHTTRLVIERLVEVMPWLRSAPSSDLSQAVAAGGGGGGGALSSQAARRLGPSRRLSSASASRGSAYGGDQDSRQPPGTGQQQQQQRQQQLATAWRLRYVLDCCRQADAQRRSLLHLAVLSGSLPLVRLLAQEMPYKYGTPPELPAVRDTSGATPLDYLRMGFGGAASAETPSARAAFALAARQLLSTVMSSRASIELSASSGRHAAPDGGGGGGCDGGGGGEAALWHCAAVPTVSLRRAATADSPEAVASILPAAANLLPAVPASAPVGTPRSMTAAAVVPATAAGTVVGGAPRAATAAAAAVGSAAVTATATATTVPLVSSESLATAASSMGSGGMGGGGSVSSVYAFSGGVGGGSGRSGGSASGVYHRLSGTASIGVVTPVLSGSTVPSREGSVATRSARVQQLATYGSTADVAGERGRMADVVAQGGAATWAVGLWADERRARCLLLLLLGACQVGQPAHGSVAAGACRSNPGVHAQRSSELPAHFPGWSGTPIAMLAQHFGHTRHATPVVPASPVCLRVVSPPSRSFTFALPPPRPPRRPTHRCCCSCSSSTPPRPGPSPPPPRPHTAVSPAWQPSQPPWRSPPPPPSLPY